MTNEYEIADDSRESLIWTKEQLLAPLLPGMEAAAARDAAGPDRAGLLPAAQRGRGRAAAGADEEPAPGNEGEVTRPDPSLWAGPRDAEADAEAGDPQ